MTMWERVRGRLAGERGDADPTLTIVSMFVAALISTLVAGMIVMVIQATSNIVVENMRATSLASAQKVWSQDANNASVVVQRDSTRVAFYELPGRAPGVFIQRGNQNSDYCRMSEWTVLGDTIVNKVSQWDNANCDIDDPTILPDRTATVLTLDGIVGAAKIVSENAAGRDLHFVAGKEIGLNAVTTTPSANARASWWRDYEWAYTQPRKINLVASTDLPLSGVSDTTLRGSTWIVTSNEGLTLPQPEEMPAVVEYNPEGLSGLSVTRSSTVGDVYAFVREGINVSFNAASCGPYSVEYTVRWAPATAGATVRQTKFTSFGQPGPVDLDRVPNGASGVVTVVAECPPSVSSRVATLTESYLQPLPGPTLSGRVAGSPHLHNLSWTAISSLPVQYRSEVNLGSGFVAQDRATPNPTAASAANLVWQEGSTFGVPHNYRVIGVLGALAGAASNTVELFTPWPVLPTPTITGTSAGLVYNAIIQPATCPAGTTAQYRHRVSLNETGFQGWSVWSATRTAQYLLEQGQKADIEGEVRCFFNAAQFSEPSDRGALTWVQPITTSPNPPGVSFTSPPAENAATTVSFVAVGCPVRTRPEYRVRSLLDAGSFGAWSGWSETPSTTNQMWFGQQLRVDVQARCLTNFTDEAKKSPVVSAPGIFVRPIPAPAAPTNPRSDAGGTSEPKNDRFLYDAPACWTATTPQYRRDHVGVGQETGFTTALTQNVVTGWGTRYEYRVLARCVSAYTVSPESPWSASTSWITNVPPVSNPTIDVPDSAFAGNFFSVVSSGANCEAFGATSVYDVSTNGSSTRWSSASFSDRWNTAGTRSYFVRAACAGPNAQGPWSATASDSIDILLVPIPAGAGGCVEGGVVNNSVSTRVFIVTENCAGANFSFFPRWEVRQLRGPFGHTGPVESGPVGEEGFFIIGDRSANWSAVYGQRRVQLCSFDGRCGAFSSWMNNTWQGL